MVKSWSPLQQSPCHEEAAEARVLAQEDDAAANGLATSAIDQASMAAEIERDVNASHQAQVEAASKRQFAAAERVAAATQIEVVAAASAAAAEEVDQSMGVGGFAHDDDEGGGMHDGEDAINEEDPLLCRG
ncbi:hypothetical protein PPROV_000095300 [Pycnococcus provasolii]|uniref:Uncharacterized protein n=1 Tax=Pycnococcus provasolii TaxID=41880 RepID=A0A830H4W1_9CHLO|nr:hypothetical protein PPROV_000095300 [Pycnococcus provasolii]